MSLTADATPSSDGPRRRRGARLARGGLTALALGVLAFVALEAGLAMRPSGPLRQGSRIVEIPAAQGVLSIAQLLRDQGIIRSRTAFVGLAVLRGTARSLKAGEYEVPRGASLLAVLQLIESGRVKPHLLVLPEGSTVRDVARQIEAEGLAPAADVLRVAGDPLYLRSLGIEAPSIEGYLFPDTYHVTKGMRIEEILGRMVHRFREKVRTLGLDATRGEGPLTLHELVTLASIVEKEALLPAERPLIARVFLNRLKRGMPLQADPTVAYALAKEGRPPTREDLLVDHPFNTYRYRGLPPGPIGSPGLAALEAVLRPADAPYLYFVAIDDRAHHFSTTLEEHNQAVARYRQYRARLRTAL
jgi:UPF0755 protein